MEAYVHGVSPRSVDDLVKALDADSGISKSEAPNWMRSRNGRSITPSPYVFLDAAYCRAGGEPPDLRHRSP
jgi:transposase-like protein